MKTLLLLLVCVSLSAQITTTGTDLSKPEIISTTDILQYELAKYEDNYYVLSFRNGDYRSFIDTRTIGFKATEEEVDSLYKDLENTIGTDLDKTYQLNNHRLVVTPKKKGLYVFVYSDSETDSMFFISKKDLSKLFGKG